MSDMRAINVRSPLRVDFVGMTDYIPACRDFGGCIVNATINKYIYCHVVPREDEMIILQAPDRGNQRVIIPSPAELNAQGELGLVQEIIRRFGMTHGLEMTTYSEMPAGAGLGSSSTITTSIIAALDALTGKGMTAHQMAELARECEQAALGVMYGWQDQYAPVTGGGVKFMKYWPDAVGWHIEVNRLPLSLASLAELEKNMIVCFTGLSRPAKMILDAVAQGFKEGKKDVIEALQTMNSLAEEIRRCLTRGQIGELGPLLAEVWRQHKRLHPEVTNERIEELYEIALRAGATGGRVCGAGGGGTMLFMAAPNKDYALRNALREAKARIFDCSIDPYGLLIW